MNCLVLLAQRTDRLRTELCKLIYDLAQKNKDTTPRVCSHPTHFIDDYQQLNNRFGFRRDRSIVQDYAPIDLLSGIEAVRTHQRTCPGCVCGNLGLDAHTVEKELERITREVRICVDCLEDRAGTAGCTHRD